MADHRMRLPAFTGKKLRILCFTEHKKTAPGKNPRGGVVFLVTAFPTVSDRHEIHRDYQ